MYTPDTCQQDTNLSCHLLMPQPSISHAKTYSIYTISPITISINNTLPVHTNTKQKRPSLVLMKQPSQSLFQFIHKLFISIFLHQHLSSMQKQSGHVHYWWHTTITLPFQFVLKLINILWRNVSTYKSHSPVHFSWHSHHSPCQFIFKLLLSITSQINIPTPDRSMKSDQPRPLMTTQPSQLPNLPLLLSAHRFLPLYLYNYLLLGTYLLLYR